MPNLKLIINPLLQTWRKRRFLRWAAIAAILLYLFWAALWIAVATAPFNDTRLRKLDVSSTIHDRNGKVLRAYLAPNDRWCFPADLKNTAPAMIQATISAEDKNFYKHHGIDWSAVARATLLNIKNLRIVSGASTISMQVAGFTIDSRERTLSRKLHQAFYALQLERHWSKDEILQCYLTHASYGGNICGVEAASLRYFNKTAKDLTPGQATLLAGLPQSPERYRPDRHLARAIQRRTYVLAQMLEDGNLIPADIQRINKFEISVDLHDVPVQAPHFCDAIIDKYPGRTKIQTTLDAGIQSQAEKLLSTAIAKKRNAGISNGAIVVLDNKSCQILAMVGSVDYWNKYDDGQVNGALGFRSPGSTLKPLIYARALDSDALAPDETLYDVPITYAGYSPQNYDRTFRGPVPAPKALAWSLNIPAMEILQRLGVSEFRGFLNQNHIEMKFSKYGNPGLSMAIGTCSIRLLDLASAYASLGNQGHLLKPVWLLKEKDKLQQETPWISAAAANVVMSALADETLRAPEGLDPVLKGLKGVAWKTGTSNGYRDAWTIAVTRNYTIGVWIGNMDGRPSRGLIGSKTAAPVALEMAQRLQKNPSSAWPPASKDIITADSCSISGLTPGPYCKHDGQSRFIKGHLARDICQLHAMVEVDSHTSQCLCTRCSSGHDIIKTVCALYPPEVESWLRSNNHPWMESIKPSHNPQCQVAALGVPPAIVAPIAGAEIVLLKELPAQEQKISLQARSANPSEKLYWFVNGNLAGAASSTAGINIIPKAGYNQVVCTDQQGRSSKSWFTVEDSDTVEKAARWSQMSESN